MPAAGKMSRPLSPSEQRRAHSTLEDVLSEFDHQRLLIEIKPNSAQVAQQLCATLERFEMDERTVVASFHGDALSAFRQACPQTPVSATSGQVLLYTLLHLMHLDAAYLNPPIAFQVPERAGPLHLVDERFVKSVRTRCLRASDGQPNRSHAPPVESGRRWNYD